jgi:hypothetical protein
MYINVSVVIVASLLSLCASAACASDNPANDWLLSQSAKEQAAMLGKVVGDGCKGKTSFYMGRTEKHRNQPGQLPPLSGHEHDTFWSIKCTDGRSYAVGVHPDGSGSVLECSMLKAVHAGECFKKF